MEYSSSSSSGKAAYLPALGSAAPSFSMSACVHGWCDDGMTMELSSRAPCTPDERCIVGLEKDSSR